MSFKNGFQAGRERDPFERIFTESPLALFGKSEIGLNARLLNTLTNNKWPLGVDPCGHYFVILNVSINKKLFSLSQVVLLTHPFLMLSLLFKDTVVT